MPDLRNVTKAMGGVPFDQIEDATVPGQAKGSAKKLRKVKGSDVMTDGKSFFLPSDTEGENPFKTREEAEKALAAEQEAQRRKE